jgi:LPS O-antigen subunit length determinant protein (WzzB/FepE family)
MRSVEFLNSLSPTVNYEEIKKALSSLQQEQMKRLMMIEGNEDYVFKVLDSPIIPEVKSKPQRAFIVILGTFLGTMLGIILTLASYFYRTSFIK